MKVNPSDPIVETHYQATQREKQSATESERRPLPEDRLEFSTASRQLQSSDTASDAPTRAERVASIERALEAGTYDINAKEVAEAIISGALLDERA